MAQCFRGGGVTPKQLNYGFDCTQKEYISDFVESKKYGFTLAETLITLTILGVVAAITVPSLINKQIESANRTKVKKAMAVYEKALNQMIIDNDAKGSIKDVEGFATSDGCSGSRPYFKTVEDGNNNCQFKTADRVWWDITDIENPIIAFKEGDLTSATAAETTTKNAFYLIGRRDDNGILRINDKGFEDSQTSNDTRKAEMAKLYNFINKVETTSGGGTGGGTTEKCTTTDNVNYTCTGSELTWTKKTLTAEEAAAASVTESSFCIWDGTTCDPLPNNTSTTNAGDMFVSPITISSTEAASACSGSRYDAENGEGSCVSDLGGDYQEAARKKCAANGAHLATVAELKAMYNMTNSPLSSGSYYWAAEAHSSGTDGAYGFSTGSGGVGGRPVDDTFGKAVCVGN